MYNEEWTTDYEGKCGNCHEPLTDGDKYCRYCGTKRGEGKFEPYQNLMQCIYGPMPVERVRKCTKCEKTWKTHLMIDNEDYCPDCGARSKIVIRENDCLLAKKTERTEKENGKKRKFGFWKLFK